MIKKLLLLNKILKDSDDKITLASVIKQAGELAGYETKVLDNEISPILVESILPVIKNSLTRLLTFAYKIPENHAAKFAEVEARKVIDSKFDLGGGDVYGFLDAYIVMTEAESPSSSSINVDAPVDTHRVGPLRLQVGGFNNDEDFETSRKVPLSTSESVIDYLVFEYVKKEDVVNKAKKFSRYISRPKTEREFLSWTRKQEQQD
jgi:hypothetical protein